MDATARFFNLLFEHGIGPDALLTVWSLPDKQTRFHADVESASADSLARAETQDVYFGLGLRHKGLRSGRGKATDVVGIPALWVDIDIAGDGHADNKKTHPPTAEDALKLLKAVYPPASLVNASGGGFHAYWLLSEIFQVEDARTLAEITTASRSWCGTIQKIARDQFGWDVDSTWDIARVLRVPGTVNHKHIPPRPVVPASDWMTAEPVRYDLTDLLSHAMDVDTLRRMAVVTGYEVRGDLVLNPQAQVDSEKLACLIANDRRFRDTYGYNRADMADMSLSGYDMALANMAVTAEWTDQDVANLLIQFRRKHDPAGPTKVLRRNYVTLTIGKARETCESGRAEQVLVREPVTPPVAAEVDDAKRAAILETLRKVLQVPFKAWIRHGEEEPEFSLILDDGRNIKIGPASVAGNQRAFGLQVWTGVRILPPTKKSGMWRQILNQLAAIETVVENPDTTRLGRLQGWLEDYGANQRVHGRGDDPWWSGLGASAPFVEDDAFWANVNHLRSHVLRMLDEKVTIKELCELLRVAGGVREKRSWRVKRTDRDMGKMVNKSYWRVPPEVYYPA